MEIKEKNKSVTQEEFQEFKDEFHEFVDFTIKNVATKDDLKAFATKDDLKAFATKEDLRRTKDELREEMLDYKSETINHVDAVLKQVVAIREEQIMKTGRDDNQDEEIGKVKNRVTNVEYHIGIEPLAA